MPQNCEAKENVIVGNLIACNRDAQRQIQQVKARIRALQEDIVCVKADTDRRVSNQQDHFCEVFEALRGRHQAVREEIEHSEATASSSNRGIRAAQAAVDAALPVRDAASREAESVAADCNALRERISEADAQARSLSVEEEELRQEIRALEQAKQNGVSNLEAVRIRNAKEAVELEAEEKRLAEARSRLQGLEEKIGALRAVRH